MQFTYDAYRSLIRILRENDYVFADYITCDDLKKSVILRHDIDYSIEKAVELAALEAEENVKSTYFVLLSSEFYNLAAKENKDKILQINRLGHDVGLHFDELNYDDDCKKNVPKLILKEVQMLEDLLQIEVKSVSMHRPSNGTLEADYDLYPYINSYGKKFFKQFKYVSDSRRRWREDVVNVIESGTYEKLHILTHAFWYHKEEKDLYTTIKDFIEQGKADRYYILDKNITDLKSILGEEIK